MSISKPRIDKEAIYDTFQVDVKYFYMKHIAYPQWVLHVLFSICAISLFFGKSLFLDIGVWYMSIVERILAGVGLLLLSSHYLTKKEIFNSHLLFLNCLAFSFHSYLGLGTTFTLPFLGSGLFLIMIQLTLIDSLYQVHRVQKKIVERNSEDTDFKRRLIRWIVEPSETQPVIFLVSKYGNYAHFFFFKK